MGSGASKATSSFSEQEASPVVAELAAGRVCRHGDGRHPVSSNGYVYHPHVLTSHQAIKGERYLYVVSGPRKDCLYVADPKTNSYQ